VTSRNPGRSVVLATVALLAIVTAVVSAWIGNDEVYDSPVLPASANNHQVDREIIADRLTNGNAFRDLAIIEPGLGRTDGEAAAPPSAKCRVTIEVVEASDAALLRPIYSERVELHCDASVSESYEPAISHEFEVSCGKNLAQVRFLVPGGERIVADLGFPIPKDTRIQCLIPPTWKVRGVVQDISSNAPVPFARVHIRKREAAIGDTEVRDESGERIARVTPSLGHSSSDGDLENDEISCDSNGEFAFESRAMRLLLRPSADGYLPIAERSISPDSATATLYMATSIVVTGLVVDEFGAPVSEAILSIRSDDHVLLAPAGTTESRRGTGGSGLQIWTVAWCMTRSRIDGTWALEVPRVPLVIGASKDGYLTATSRIIDFTSLVVLTLGLEYRVRGTVRRRDSGSLNEVVVYSKSEAGYHKVEVDSTGRFDLPGAPGRVRIGASGPGLTPEAISVECVERQTDIGVLTLRRAGLVRVRTNPGMTVVLIDSRGDRYEQVAGDGGVIEFKDVVPGMTSIGRLDDEMDRRIETNVGEGESVECTIE
jgi:hypothetical protein